MTETTQHITIGGPVLIMVGPTGVGKTSLSIELAKRYDCEIVSVDSMQVYRYLDIGTAKISETDKQGIRHHLIDIVDPDQSYDAATFVRDCLKALAEIQSRGKLPLLTGGTGLYLQALKYGLFDDGGKSPQLRKQLSLRLQQEGSFKLHQELADLDPAAAKKIHPNDRVRVVRALEVCYQSGETFSARLARQADQASPVRFERLLTIGLKRERKELYRRINHRTELMLEQGLETEVRQLLDKGYPVTLKPLQAIGYRHLIQYLTGDCSYPEMVRLLSRDTRRYAKRQQTWFKRDDSIEWFNLEDPPSIIKRVDSWLEKPIPHAQIRKEGSSA